MGAELRLFDMYLPDGQCEQGLMLHGFALSPNFPCVLSKRAGGSYLSPDLDLNLWRVRHNVERSHDGAAFIMNLIDPLKINRDVVALTQLIMGFSIVLLRVLAHVFALIEFFNYSGECATDVGRAYPYSVAV